MNLFAEPEYNPTGDRTGRYVNVGRWVWENQVRDAFGAYDYLCKDQYIAKLKARIAELEDN